MQGEMWGEEEREGPDVLCVCETARDTSMENDAFPLREGLVLSAVSATSVNLCVRIGEYWNSWCVLVCIVVCVGDWCVLAWLCCQAISRICQAEVGTLT